MVVEGLLSLQRLSWVIALLLIIVYISAVFFCIMIGTDMDWYPDDFKHVYFGDMLHGLITLIDIAILVEWPEIVRPVTDVQLYLLPVFLLFVVICSFGMMNVMIGVIVDSTASAKQEIERVQKDEKLNEAQDIWKSMVEAQGGTIDPNESHTGELLDGIMDKILHSKVIDFPSGLKAEDVIVLLDFDASGDVTMPEFVSGLSRLLHGNSFQLTCLLLTVIGKMRKEHKQALEAVRDRLARADEEHDEMKQEMDTLLTEIIRLQKGEK